MKLLFIAALGIAAPIAIVTAVGWLLPKGHVASRRARFRQSPEAIWEALTNFAAFPSWRPGVTTVEALPARDGHVFFREKGKFGEITMEIMEAVRPARLVGRIADGHLPFGGSWTYLISAERDATILTITEDGEVFNPIYRFVSRFVVGHHRTVDDYLKALGKKFGETVSCESAALVKSRGA
jgi:uncharacterized protein YndB with AHSA1/START domain